MSNLSWSVCCALFWAALVGAAPPIVKTVTVSNAIVRNPHIAPPPTYYRKPFKKRSKRDLGRQIAKAPREICARPRHWHDFRNVVLKIPWNICLLLFDLSDCSELHPASILRGSNTT